MTSIDTAATTIHRPDPDFAVEPAHLAAAAFLARYSGRTVDAYRHDLRGYFNWGGSVGLVVLEATRPHIELYRRSLEEQGLAASTIDLRLSTVCGFYRSPHIDGRVASNPAHYAYRARGIGPIESWGPRSPVYVSSLIGWLGITLTVSKSITSALLPLVMSGSTNRSPFD